MSEPPEKSTGESAERGTAASAGTPPPAEADVPSPAPEVAAPEGAPPAPAPPAGATAVSALAEQSAGAPAADATGTSLGGASDEVAAPASDVVAPEAATVPASARRTKAPEVAPEDDDGVDADDLDDDDDDLVDLDDDDDDDDDEDEDDDEPRRRGGLLTKQIQVDARMILAIVVVLALFAGAYVLGQRQGESAKDPVASGPTATTVPPTPKDFVPFEDKDTGVKLAYPKEWAQISTRELDASYRLLISVPNSKDNFRVRVNAYSREVTKTNVADQKAVIDAIFSEEKITILNDTVVDVNGLPALFYVYKFTDSTGEPGYHAHFFVFQGRKMVSLVFEAVPEARYALLAPVFDAIANSLQVAPGEPPAFLQELTGTGTTAPGATTVPPVATTKQP